MAAISVVLPLAATGTWCLPWRCHISKLPNDTEAGMEVESGYSGSMKSSGSAFGCALAWCLPGRCDTFLRRVASGFGGWMQVGKGV